jgi:hypothetical protein
MSSSPLQPVMLFHSVLSRLSNSRNSTLDLFQYLEIHAHFL